MLGRSTVGARWALVVVTVALPGGAVAAPRKPPAPPPPAAVAAGSTCKLTAVLQLADTAGGAPGKKRLKSGAALVVKAVDKTWAQVDSEGVSGWVKQALLQRRCKLEPPTPATTEAPDAPAAPPAEPAPEQATAPAAPPATEPAVAAPASPPGPAAEPSPATAPGAPAEVSAAPEAPAAPAATPADRSPGRLLVKVSEPGASVLVDGQLVGQSPLAAFALEPGPHVLTVEKLGWIRAQKDVDVSPGAEVAAELTLLPAALPVTTAPGSALLRFAGYGLAAAGLVGIGASAALLSRDPADDSKALLTGWAGLGLGLTGAVLVGLGSDIFGAGTLSLTAQGRGVTVAGSF